MNCPVKKRAFLVPDGADGKRITCPYCRLAFIGTHPEIPLARHAPPLPAAQQAPAPPAIKIALPPRASPTCPPTAAPPGAARSLSRGLLFAGVGIGALLVVTVIATLGVILAGGMLRPKAPAPALAKNNRPDERGPKEPDIAPMPAPENPKVKPDTPPPPVDQPNDPPKPKTQPEPMIVVRSPFDDNKSLLFRLQIHSVAKLLEHVKFITTAANRNDMYEQLVKAGPAVLKTPGTPDLDLNKPLGAYAQVQPGSKSPTFVVLIPVGDKAKFTTALNLPETPAPDGNYYFQIAPDAPKNALRFAHGYAYVCVAEPYPKSDADLLKPDQVFSDEPATISARLRIDRLPNLAMPRAELKKDTDAMRTSLLQDRTKAQREFAEKCMDGVLNLFADFQEGARELSFTVDMNHKTRKLTFELRLDAVEGSELAKTLAGIGEMNSLFGEYAEGDAAFRFLLHAKMTDELRALWVPFMRETTQIVLQKDADDPAALKEFKQIMQALHPTIESGELDIAARMRAQNGKLSASLFGIKAPSSQAVEKLLKDKVAQLKDPLERKLYRWDAEKVDGVGLHELDFPGLLPPLLAEVQGDNPYYLAFRKDAVLAASGPDARAELRKAIRSVPKQAPPFLLEVNVKHMVEILPDDGIERKLARKHFTDGDMGQVQLSLRGGDPARLRLQLDLSLLAFIMELMPTQIGIGKKD
jgi:hypothetical protein